MKNAKTLDIITVLMKNDRVREFKWLDTRSWDEIKETIPATIEDGYIVFETSHLSQYGIVATRIENTDPNPETGDNIVLIEMIFMMSMLGIMSTKLKALDI